MSTLDDKFRAVAEKRIAAARAALSEGDPARGLTHEIHTLKGEATLLGFAAVARVAQQIELLVRRGGAPEDIEAGLALLDQLRARARDDADAVRDADAFEARVRERA